jgi:hypothetical protein
VRTDTWPNGFPVQEGELASAPQLASTLASFTLVTLLMTLTLN